jgi:ArsR family transcriptional regulator
MALPSPIPEPVVELIADRFRLLAEPMRVRLLDSLRERGEASVGELAELLGTTQQNVSKHLGVLYRGGVVARRREGNRVLYSIADETVFAICEAVCGSIERRIGAISDALAEAA